MKVLKLLAEYLFLSKKIETETGSKMIKLMHRINRFSLLLFLFCLVMLISKLITQSVFNF